MNTQEYLEAVLRSQNLKSAGEEMHTLNKHRSTVEGLIAEAFPESSPTIRFGGSRAKGTMIKESYDLDIICYFPRDDSDPGESLEKIYQSVKAALDPEYYVEPKRSSLRLKGKGGTDFKRDFHVDVVPGRFVDERETDAFLHQHLSPDGKKWLKTNIQTHVDHVRGSGLLDAIRLMKLWNVRNAVNAKTFVLELVTIELLKSRRTSTLEKQLVHVLEEFRDNASGLSVTDPANGGNDLKPVLDQVRWMLSGVAISTLSTITSQGWEAVFGPVAEAKSAAIVVEAAAAVTQRTRPWSAS